jgi:hypothetical protein
VRNGTWGPADDSGNWQSLTMTLSNGHYELDANQTAPGTPGRDKNKVFWVECGSGTTAGSDKDKAEADEDASSAPDTDNDVEDQAEAANGTGDVTGVQTAPTTGSSGTANSGAGQAVAGFQSPPSNGAVGAVPRSSSSRVARTSARRTLP